MQPTLAVDSQRRRLVSAGAAAVAATGLYFVNPNTTHVPLCPFHSVTGLWCPLCGGTRAAYALLHGQFGAALQDNLLAVLGIPALLWLWWRWSSAGPARRLLAPRVVWALVLLGAVFTVWRNLPGGAWLAPPR